MPFTKIALTAIQIIATLVLGFIILPRLQLYYKDVSPLILIPGIIGWLAVCMCLYCLKLSIPYLARQLTASSVLISEWAQQISVKNLKLSIIASAALLLFLELSLIRWQSSLFPAFALYKNFTLLACFCGLGIGFALAKKTPLLIGASLPVLACNLLFLTLLRYGSLPANLSMFNVVPVNEESSVFGGFLLKKESLNLAQISLYYMPVYFLLFSTFTLNVLTLLPIGQLCGFLMERTKPLTGYGLNLTGSIIGVVLLFILSSLWLGPVIWFGLAAAGILWFLMPSILASRIGIGAALLCVSICAWPTEPLVQNIYSPYQLIQKVTKADGYMQILASGSYYQKVFNFKTPPEDKFSKFIYAYYELPFRTARSLADVAIVGAGSGNDVAAAIRNNAQSVDAVEIDPVIRDLGLMSHPEHPYSNPKVHSYIDDARTFFRSTQKNYDVIVYGVLDSHILLSHGSNVRVDSFVYTQQGLQESYARLKPGGLFSVSFALMNPLMGKKIFSILETLPNASEPVTIFSGYDRAATTFMVKKAGQIQLPGAFMADYGLENQTDNYKQMAVKNLDLPSDDWPFFYMDYKMYPASYVVSLVLILIISVFMVRIFLPEQRWQRSLTPFFFLGGGFMLTETKAITELGLIFGNTWHVVGITIISVLVMAFCANLAAVKLSTKIIKPMYILLFIVIAIGFYIAKTGGLNTNSAGLKLLSVLLLVSPLFFSGIIFSLLLKDYSDVSSAIAYNLMGAMLGGLLEYNSMQYGFASLYLISLALYILAFISGNWKNSVKL